jgi:hypothetical protein
VTDPGDPSIEEIDVDSAPASNVVHIASGVVVGACSCSRAGLDAVLYGTDTLQVVISFEGTDQAGASQPENTAVGCDAEIYVHAYGLRVAVEDGLPNRVVVREPAGGGEDGGRVRTVER